MVTAKSLLFIGVDTLYQFGYQQIREFARKILITLAADAPNTRHVVTTIHGAEYGLDEAEAFDSEIAGFVDAISAGEYPDHLAEITIVEQDPRRAERLSALLMRLLPRKAIPVSGLSGFKDFNDAITDRLRLAGYDSANRSHIFVAMPFHEDEDMEDMYHYGIQSAANAAGFLCERADLSSFTGDVMVWVKERIASSTLVIADLTTANPNVYLEVGYAWGCNRPTVLLVRNAEELKFDVKGQRCLVYKNIRELERSLSKELNNLRETLK